MKKIVLFMLLALLPFLNMQAQQSASDVVTGVVKDQITNKVLPGATVMVKGTYRGTTSDANGKFSISIRPEDKMLEVSFVGYETTDVNLNNQTYLEVLLPIGSQAIEAVEIGYTAKPKANLLGAVTSVSIDDAEMRALPNADVMLAGKVAGMSMTQNSGQPGHDGYEIRIRGVSSISNQNAPLVIIDGIEGNINSVNPKDIATMSVLKDASSAAIYGVKAAAGVIIITTKRGDSGVHLSYSNSFSLQKATCLPDIINDPLRYIDLANEAFVNSGRAPRYSSTVREEFESGKQLPTDWKDIFFDNGFMQTHHVSLTGGGENYDFAASAGFKDHDGVVYSTRAKSLDYAANVNGYLMDHKLHFGLNMRGSEDKSHEAIAANKIVQRFCDNRPLLFAKSLVEKEYNLYSGGGAPLAIEELGGGNNIVTNNLSSTLTADFSPIKGLMFKVSYNITNSNSHETQHTPKYKNGRGVDTDLAVVKRSSLVDLMRKNRRETFFATASFDRTFGDHTVGALIGVETHKIQYKSNSIKGYDLVKNEPLVKYLDPETITVNAGAFEETSLSFFGRLSYDYKGRYLVEANIRRDGTSVFNPGCRYHTSPSVAVAWRMGEESFLKDVEWLNNLKLRASYGQLGNYSMGSNHYTGYNRISPEQYYAFGGVMHQGLAITELANGATTWEKIYQTNVGLDFGFLNKFSLSFEWYNKVTEDMLASVYQPLSLGAGLTSVANTGKMRNRGFEFTFDYNHQINKDLRVNVNFNIGYCKNTVLNLGGNKDQWHTTDGSIRSEVGFPFQSIYGYQQIGFYQVDDFTWQNDSDPSIPHMERQYQLKDGVQTTTLHAKPRPGDLMLLDVDDNGTIDSKDIVRLGRGRSNIQYALNLNVTYKGFNVSILGQGQGDSQVYLKRWGPYSNGFGGQIFTYLEKQHWTPENTNHRALFADKQRAAILSTYDLHNAAYFRVKNIQLSYTFKGRFLEKLKLGSLSVYLSAENPFTISDFPDGWDPERSVDNNMITAYPLVKSYTAGLILNF